MASIRKRGNSYLLVVSMGYDPGGHRRKPQQKTVHPPEGLTPKAKEKWLEEEAALFERQCKNQPLTVDKPITLAAYTAYWLAHIAPGKLAKSTLARDKQDIDRFLPALGSYKLTDLKPEHFRNLYAQLRKQKNSVTGKPLSESTVEGIHACLCGILSDAMEGGFLSQNPAWRTYKYAGKKRKSAMWRMRKPHGNSLPRWRRRASSTKHISNSSSPRGCDGENAAVSNGKTWTFLRSPSTSAATW